MKNKKSKIRWIIIVVATVFIVSTSVKLGLMLSENFNNNESSSEKRSLNKKEETKDFVINYTEETYKLDSDKKVAVENRRTIPTISSGKYPVAANKIAVYLKQSSESKWNELKSAADSYEKNNTDTVGVDYIISNVEQNDLYFSFKTITTGTIGESKWDEERVYSFNTKTGDILSIKDIASDEIGLRKAIYNLIVDYIDKQDYAKELDSDWKTRVSKEIITEGNWYLSNDGINYVFATYTYGPGHIGKIKYTVKYKDINNYLANEYKKNA